ncbi:MAG: FG-GAP-like repeat-containing protein [bacterium]
MIDPKNIKVIKKIIIVAACLIGVFFLILLLLPEKSFKWNAEAGYRWAELPALNPGQPGFTLLPSSKTKIAFTNSLTEDQIKGNRFLLGGSGVATGDVDGDGLIDLYFCGLDTSNILYKNVGNWKFKDITERAGVACSNRFSTGATFADIDGDSDLDLLVTALGGPNACFLNDGAGTFTEVTDSAGLKSTNGSTSMTLADIDGDGDLDLYMTNFKKISVESLYAPRERAPNRVAKKVGDTYEILPQFKQHYRVEIVGGQPTLFENAEPDILYLNDGNGIFSPASFTGGRFLDEAGNPVSELKDWGLQPRFQDMDNDGDPDIYVCNDYWSPDRIWINDGSGHFQAIAKLAVRHTSRFTMAVDFSDVDRDGDTDFLLIDMLSQNHQRRMQQIGTSSSLPPIIGQFDDRPQIKRNTLFLNRGDNTYAEIGQFSGVQASEWTWSVRFLDVDLDGYEDILATNGQLHDFEDSDTNDRVQRLAAFGYDYRQLTMLYPKYLTPNVAFRNKGDLTFENVSQKWGFTTPDIAWGMAFADFDNDGDLDIATNRLHDPAGIYRNEASAPRIAVRLKGLAKNTQGIGAKIRLEGGPVLQQKEVMCAGTYLSGSDPMVTFAADSVEKELAIEVIWRSGKISRINNVIPNRIYEIDETGAISLRDSIVSPFSPDSTAKPFFDDVSHLIDHEHHEDVFDDFKRQPLLPYRLSQLGPGVAWHDIDSDGDDDLMIASGKGGQFACFRNNGERGFSKIRSSAVAHNLEQDQTAVLGWTKAGGEVSVLVGGSNYEDRRTGDAFFMNYDFKNSIVHSRQVLNDKSGIGPMVMADIDGDGDLDLFVGGRSTPGRYPEPASSLLYRNERGAFTIDKRNSQQFHLVGMASGAVFSDLDKDGDPDLILAIEWGPVKVFRNNNGHFLDITVDLGLDHFTGRWNGVTTGDLDEDGNLDIIATNWGLNTAYPASAENLLRIYYGDFDGNGTLDIVEAHFDRDMNKVVPDHSLTALSQAIPYVRSRTPTFKSFAAAGVDEIVGNALSQSNQLRVNRLEHTLFLNRNDHFEAVALPKDAQLAPAFYAGVADFDGDGHEDIFLSQNFFAVHPETGRYDAGRGLWLKGDGTGKLAAVPGHVSGIMVYGEQRGAALSDYDKDGRVDLVVTQNGAATKLYRNIGANPGLRVRLIGPKKNPAGVGAVVRIEYEDGNGPAREIHAGSGYWSQDSAVQVMGKRANPTGVWVRWPDGRISESQVTEGAVEVIVSYQASSSTD